MYDCNDMTLAVKVVLNPKTTNQTVQNEKIDTLNDTQKFKWEDEKTWEKEKKLVTQYRMVKGKLLAILMF